VKIKEGLASNPAQFLVSKPNEVDSKASHISFNVLDTNTQHFLLSRRNLIENKKISTNKILLITSCGSF